MPSLESSPGGSVLVVCGNVEEVFHPDDTRSARDLDLIAKRVAAFCPYIPDVALLQEVNMRSAGLLATNLAAELGPRFDVAVASERHDVYMSRDKMKQTMRDTAILLNSENMRKITPGGFVATKIATKDVPAGTQHLTLEHAHILAGKRRSRLKIALASLHFVRHDCFPGTEKTYEYKKRWLEQVDDFLVKTYGEQATVRVIAGDLNIDRPVRRPEKVRSKERSFWTTITASRGYLDAVFVKHARDDETLKQQFRRGQEMSKKRIDFIFVHGRVDDASHDLDYGAQKGDPDYASEHRMLYALVGRDRKRH